MAVDSLIPFAHAQLVGLKGNIPDERAAKEFIDLFHTILDDLEALGTDLTRFRVPEEAIHESITVGTYCSSHFLRAKVDGLLALFSVSGDKKQIGFMANQ